MTLIIDPVVPCILVKLHKLEINALLDPGSAQSFIIGETFNKLCQSFPNLPVTKVARSCTMANANSTQISESVKLKVTFLNFSWKQEFWVFQDLAFQAVLGTDFMTATGLSLNFDRTSLRFQFKPDLCVPVPSTVSLMSMGPLTEECSQLPSVAHLPEYQQERLFPLLQDFSDVLTDKLGLTTVGMCHLELIDARPCRSHPYPLPPPKLKLLREHIEKLVKSGVVVESSSDYSSPCFLVPKKDGGHRLVVDYRKVNALIRFDTFPLPTVETALMHFGGAKYFSILDLNSAYHQIPLHTDSQRYSCFTTPFGSYSYTRLPFGLSVGGQTLSRILNKIFQEVTWDFLFLYLDDLLIYSNSFDEHMTHLSFVLAKLREAGFTVNPSKVSICAKEISYLGYLISEAGIRVNPDRIRPILDFPIPVNVRQVRRFLGMCGFYAKFVPHMSQITEPLNALKRKHCKFKWGKEQQTAFDSLKVLLSNPPLLHSPRFDQQFILQTDASDRALGAVLQQWRGKDLVPVAYASRLLSNSEINISTYEKEGLAAIWACERFAKFIEHTHFILQTDNQALSWLKAQPHSLGKIGRWLYRLSAFSFEVQHISAHDNPVADALSRLFEVPLEPAINSLLPDYPLSFQSIQEHQREDEFCTKLINQLEIGMTVKNYCMSRQLLAFKPKNVKRCRVVVPKGLHSMILKYFHASPIGSHLGVRKTIHKVSTHFYWPNMNNIITNFVKTCTDCQYAKPAARNKIGFSAAQSPTAPWHCIHVDFVGPLVRSSNGKMGIFSIIDTFSKFVLLFPVRNITSQVTTTILTSQVFNVFGPPRTIVSDNHSVFVSKTFKDMCFDWGVNHCRTSPYRPQGSHVERFHRNLRSALIIFSHANQQSWDFYIPYIQTAYNSAWHSSTKCTPSSLFLGRELSHPLLLAWNIHLDDDLLDPISTEKRCLDALNNLKEATRRSAKTYNKTRIPTPFKVDDQVLLLAHPISSAATKFSAKLAQRWLGPYSVHSFLTPVTVLLRLPSGTAPLRQAHVSHLKAYHTL